MLTRRDIIIKWSTYAGAFLTLLFFCSLLLHNMRFWGVSIFIPPLLVGVVAAMEETRAGIIFGLVCGLLCDISVPGTFPCIYTLAFPVAALLCSNMAKSVLQRGMICSLTVSVLTFLIVDALNMIALFFKDRAPFDSMLELTVKETALSCVLLIAVHPLAAWLHRKFTI